MRKNGNNPFSFHAPNAFSHRASAHSEFLHELRFSESLTRNISSFIKPADYRSHDARGRAVREARRVRCAVLVSHGRVGNLLTTRATCRHAGSATAQVNSRSTSVVEAYGPTTTVQRPFLRERFHANVSGEGLGPSCQELNVRRSCQAIRLDIRASATNTFVKWEVSKCEKP